MINDQYSNFDSPNDPKSTHRATKRHIERIWHKLCDETWWNDLIADTEYRRTNIFVRGDDGEPHQAFLEIATDRISRLIKEVKVFC